MLQAEPEVQADRPPDQKTFLPSEKSAQKGAGVGGTLNCHPGFGNSKWKPHGSAPAPPARSFLGLSAGSVYAITCWTPWLGCELLTTRDCYLTGPLGARVYYILVSAC